MPRVKNGPAHHARKKKIMKAAKGGFQSRSKLYKAARENVERGLAYAYRDRRKKKGEFRALWITRINAAARQHGLSYSRLMDALKRAPAFSIGYKWGMALKKAGIRDGHVQRLDPRCFLAMCSGPRNVVPFPHAAVDQDRGCVAGGPRGGVKGLRGLLHR